MHRTIFISAATLAYYAVATYALYSFHAGLLVTALIFYGFPALLLARFTLAPPAMLLAVAFLGGGLSILLQAIAHLYGLWYVAGAAPIRLFGLVPTEQVVATALASVFLVLLYENFFDDGRYTARSARHRLIFFVLWFFGVIVLLALQQHVLGGVFVSYSFIWTLIIMIGSATALVAMHRSLSLRFFDRITDFAIMGAIPLGLALFVGVHSGSIVFPDNPEFLGVIWYFGQAVPIEAAALLFTLPYVIGAVYEIYLDDQA